MKHVIIHMLSGEKIDCYTAWDIVESMVLDENFYFMIATYKNNTKPRLISKGKVESYEILIGGEL